jgi:hypothetical protein
MTKYAKTILKMSIHREEVNPVYGEGNTYLSVEDEAGGPFLLIEQDNDGDVSSVRIDYEEFLVVAEAASEMMHQLYIEKAAMP